MQMESSGDDIATSVDDRLEHYHSVMRTYLEQRILQKVPPARRPAECFPSLTASLSVHCGGYLLPLHLHVVGQHQGPECLEVTVLPLLYVDCSPGVAPAPHLPPRVILHIEFCYKNLSIENLYDGI